MGSNIETSTTEEDDWEEWDPSKISFLNHMVAGSMAGLAEHITIFPIDTIKTHIQCEKCGSISPFQTWACAEKIVRREGMLRLWRGVSAMFAGCVPAHALYFTIYENSKILLGIDDQSGHHPVRAAICGASAALSHDMIMTPFDTVKQRMQLGYYSSLWNCFKTIIKKEGVGALYISLPTTLFMNIPYGCVMVSVNESLKKVLNPSGEYKMSSTMISGGIAGMIASILTNPLDVIKTKLQTQSLEPLRENCPRGASSPSLLPRVPISVVNKNLPMLASPKEIMKSIYKEYGMLGFARGMFPRVLLQAPSVAISWTAYEAVKNLLTYTTSPEI